MQARLFHLHALSALHCGTGQSVGVVDLPIARARSSGLPQVPGSSLRGVWRAHMESLHERGRDVEALFGPRNISDNAGAFAGALAVGDAHLLTLPVRSLAGVICHVTCPFILRRYRADLGRANLTAPALPAAPAEGQAALPKDSVNVLEGKLVLEDLDLGAKTDPALDAWADWIAAAIEPEDADCRGDMAARIALIPDRIFSFLAETGTEIRPRIAIDPETGTVRRGALWYEENLPAEAVLWGLYALSDSNRGGDERKAEALAAALPDSGLLLQLGGKAGVGRGLVRLLRSGVNHG